MSSSPKKKGMALGVALGAVAGVITGILFAPKSGKETREDIKNVTLRAAHKAQDEAGELLGQAKELGDKAHDKAKTAIDEVKHTADSLKSVVSSFKNGKADDKDLDKAVKKAKEAQDALKKFLKK